MLERLRWSRGSVLAFSTQVRGFKPGRSRRKNPQHASLRRGSKAVGPMSKWRGSRHFGKSTGQHSRPQFHLPPLRSLASWLTWRHLVAKVGTSKRGGKLWQTIPNNLPRMQHTWAIPVTWMSSGLCRNRPKGWIPIIINNCKNTQMWNLMKIGSVGAELFHLDGRTWRS